MSDMPCEKRLGYETQPDPPPYPPKEEQRAPLLSDDQMTGGPHVLTDRSDRGMVLTSKGQRMSASEVRDHYEDLITSGELMVVKTIKHNVSSANIGECDLCHKFYGGSDYFCPGCGAKIIA